MSEVGVQGGPIRVLHVDDDTAYCELVAEYLGSLNQDVTVVSETDPRCVPERLRRESIECVVSDYQMPEMTGVDLLERVRQEYPNLPFILFTGKGSEAVAEEAINAGVTGYTQKGGSEVYELLANQIENAVGHRRSEHRARIAQDRLLELYEQTDGFFVMDTDWTITYWNRTMTDRTGRPADEVVGRPFLEAFPDAEGTELHERYREAFASDESVSFETYYRPHGYWVTVRAIPVEDGLFVHSREITEERERKEELERRNRILESFANTVSHDLRSPLSVAEGKLQLAQETGDFDHLKEVAQAHNRMRNLIDGLLRVARGEDLTSSTLSLRAVVRAAWQTVTAESTDLVVETDLTVEGHETQVQRLLENLFWNAVDHGEATTIRVGELRDGGFFVEDDGVGIPPADREAAFESGFSTDANSPGYGLSIVEGIVETHGWQISVTEGEAGGARFEITTGQRREETDISA